MVGKQPGAEVGIGKSPSIKGSAVLYLNIVSKRLGIGGNKKFQTNLFLWLNGQIAIKQKKENFYRFLTKIHLKLRGHDPIVQLL